ncbi:MAG TPA: hypothetical protein DHU59_01130 [Clostridiales bacterium]|nr:hypothetical protein [Clostridiales bacterium]
MKAAVLYFKRAWLVVPFYSAKKKDKLLDRFCRFFSVGAVSLPTFWVALFLQLIFYRWLQLLPLGGQLDARLKLLYEIPRIMGLLTFDTLISGNMTLFVDALKHIILPAITISLYPIGLVARMTRSALLEILGEDYIKAARSYGLKESLILWKYALKNSLGTTATVLALSVGYTLVNTFLVEAIFNWSGIGNYISTAVNNLKLSNKYNSMVIVHDEKYKDMEIDSLLAEYEKKYDDWNMKTTNNMTDKIYDTCLRLHGKEFAERFKENAETNNRISPYQFWFGYYYLRQEEFLNFDGYINFMKKQGFNWNA